MTQTRINVIGLSAVTLTTFILIAVSRFIPSLSSPIVLGVLFWAGLEGLISFLGVSWSLGRSNKTFYSWFFGGSLIRLASLGVLAYIVVALHMAPTIPLLSLVTSYFILSLVQIPFLIHGLR